MAPTHIYIYIVNFRIDRLAMDHLQLAKQEKTLKHMTPDGGRLAESL